MRRRLVTGGLAVLAIAMVVLAIRSWTTDESDRARGAVEKFAAAVEHRDYRTICTDLLADDLQDKLQAVDLPCERAMKLGFGSVRNPRLTVENVVVVDDRARAAVRTDAAGQTPSADVLSLEKQDGSWRVSALNQTASTASTGTDAQAPVPAETVITTPTPVKGDLTPDTAKLPDDARIQDRSGKGKTAAEKRRDARLRALQRRALRVQGDRGQ
ncbi:hypothetical protein AB0L40_18145 [Patulibacter sp. NPDC049589]|uniref:hypothetical protein n=1 Tax=Patulibacter sp. NPDC049589 TaxID=3154731 RepID=UPI0034149F6B